MIVAAFILVVLVRHHQHYSTEVGLHSAARRHSNWEERG